MHAQQHVQFVPLRFKSCFSFIFFLLFLLHFYSTPIPLLVFFSFIHSLIFILFLFVFFFQILFYSSSLIHFKEKKDSQTYVWCRREIKKSRGMTVQGTFFLNRSNQPHTHSDITFFFLLHPLYSKYPVFLCERFFTYHKYYIFYLH